MKTMILATAAVLGIGIGSAYADSEGGTVPNNWFTQLPGRGAHPPGAAGPQRGGREPKSGANRGLRDGP